MQRKRLKRLFDHACPKDSPLQYDACCILLSSFLSFLPLPPLYSPYSLSTSLLLSIFPPSHSFSLSLPNSFTPSSLCVSPLPSLFTSFPSLSLLSFYFLALLPLSFLSLLLPFLASSLPFSFPSFPLPFLLRLEATLPLTERLIKWEKKGSGAINMEGPQGL